MPRFSEAASMLKVASSTSTNTGTAPASATASPVAQKVKDGQNTASPRPMPLAISTIISASVPLAQLTTCFAPQKAASSASSLRDLRTVDELAMGEHAGSRLVDGFAEPAALRGEVDEGDLIRRANAGSWSLAGIEKKTSARLADHPSRPLARGRGRCGLCRVFQAAGRNFKAGDALVAGHRRAQPVRTACRNATNSARSGSSWPTGRCRIE